MHGAGIDEVLAEETSNGVSWALADHLGTIHDWVDASSGSSQHYVYSAFGRVLSIGGQSPQYDPHLFGFTGRETDADTGLTDGWMYYRARYYNPSSGRFVSQDPIGFAGGDANLYRYVGNHSTLSVDLTGLAETIGWVYEISEFVDGQWVVKYVGKADDLHVRLADADHPAADLIARSDTRIRVREIHAEPDSTATARGTQRAALDQAQRCVEQKVMGSELPERNSIRAATPENEAAWKAAHKSKLLRARVFKPAGTTQFKAGGYALLIVSEVEVYQQKAVSEAVSNRKLAVIDPNWGYRCYGKERPDGYVFATQQLTFSERASQYSHNTMVFLNSWLLGPLHYLRRDK